MSSIRLLTISIAFGVGVIAQPAQSQDIRISLIKTDDYAVRRMVVFSKSGVKMSSVVRIRSFDPATNSFVMEDVAGEAINVPVSDTEEIEFEQTVRQQSPAAQEGPWVIAARPGLTLKYKVPQNALRVESTELILPAASPVTSSSPPPTTSAETSDRKGSIVKTDKIAEAKRLTYDSSTKSFLIEVQEVTYSREALGTSGVSGIRK
jgi:hypothetical protein